MESTSWDWPLLYYIGTVTLGMTPCVFWRTTPAQLNLLSGVHADINSVHKDKVAKTIEEAGIDI